MINSVSPVNVNKVAFKAEIPEHKLEEKESEKQSSKSWMLWTGLAALGAVGIYLATRGKKASESVEKAAENATEQIKDMAVDAFKKAGNKFEKGKAKLANGEGYTGNLTQKLKDGKTVVREYKAGILEKASIIDGEKVLSSKSYTYDDKGKLTNIKNVYHRDIFAVSRDNGIEITDTLKSRVVQKDGKLKYVLYSKPNKAFVAYYPDGKTKRFVRHEDGSTRLGGYDFYDINGNLIDNIGIQRNTKGPLLYKYNNLVRSYFEQDFVKGKRYTLIKDDKWYIYENLQSLGLNGEPLWKGVDLRIKMPNQKSFKYSLRFDDTRKNIEIHDNIANEYVSPETDKKLYDELVSEARMVYKEIFTKHKKALKLKKEIDIADKEYEQLLSSCFNV